ncbi:signal peptide prediction [Amphibiibacter pelophylacis]|uniref:Signal peptide prediction n=1 Tax=Amphibiibacter pelophylacis TaxID=1799477 RepID=A0ACC6P1D5_9BURK
MNPIPALWRILWPLPCSAVGLVLGLPLLALGGSVRRVGPTLEIALRARQYELPRWVHRLRFGGITFGHVILGQSHELLAVLRAHERVHVRQYERLGIFFFVAYPLASLVSWWRGQGAHAGNRFERQAVAQSAPDSDQARSRST